MPEIRHANNDQSTNPPKSAQPAHKGGSNGSAK